MSFAISAAAAALAVAAGLAHLLIRDRKYRSQLRSVEERMRELTARVEAAEADVAHAVTSADISESLLVEKGIADEEDIEAVRRRFDGGDATTTATSSPSTPSRYVPGRDGGLH